MNKLEELLNRQYTKTEALGMMIIIFTIGTCLDVILGHSNLFLIVFSICLVIVGHQQRKKGKPLSGNIFLSIGVIFLFGTFLISIAFYLMLAAVAIYYGYHLFKSSAHPEKVEVKIAPEVFEFEKKAYVKIEPFFKNMLVGKMRHLEDVYELDDINIQFGLGDIYIDLSNTMIPVGETVILIRGLVGNIRLDVPYDIELSMHTSMLVGKTNLFNESQHVFNVTQKYRTAEYKTATRKVKVVTSVFISDIEVRNV